MIELVVTLRLRSVHLNHLTLYVITKIIIYSNPENVLVTKLFSQVP